MNKFKTSLSSLPLSPTNTIQLWTVLEYNTIDKPVKILNITGYVV